jgi:hypothetical protein|uniref:Uncharacterized protein n=1 Tax=Myoviridae sp. ctshb19 TaxID=2825194 RepID=A0A8S5UGW3_9CAUD|nr:MAG TPA: hypothetical protein [Myoviridae sp. ctshb19]
MKIEFNMAVERRWIKWGHVYFTLWHPALIYGLCIWFMWNRLVRYQPETLFSTVIDNVKVTITQGYQNTMWDQILIVLVAVLATGYFKDTFGTWWKTIRRLNYNRVSRIG